eukprot:TRINITY_DN575_c0_g1_i1.p1 TRINITY_DN575_c0_g1~~TRINITY_DN575_c0_g1_i1.p1  ORF type:complete len:332 (-),score=104.76 TRINITY_DN575_c0_g1_i1:198-1193(-)
MAQFYTPPDEKPWGAVLDKANNSIMWPTDSEISEGDMKLEISQATLGVGVKAGERNVVELSIISDENPDTTRKFPVVSLREGLSEHSLLNLTLNAPVCFRLVEGTGPICIMGVQHTLGEGDSSDDDSDDDDDGDGGIVKAESGVSGKKRKLDSPASGDAKKSKLVKDSPIVAGKGGLTKKDTKEEILKLMGGDSGDDSGDDMDEFSDGDSDDDDDDGKNGLDLGDDSLSDEVDEKPTKPSPQGKKEKQKKGQKPSAKPQEKKPTGAKGAKGDDKSSKIQPASMEAVKAKIRANKSLPKTEEKFKNYIKGMRVSDPGQVTELWKFVQQIRKP